MEPDASSCFISCWSCRYGPFLWNDDVILFIWWWPGQPILVEYLGLPLMNLDLGVLSSWTKFWCQYMPQFWDKIILFQNYSSWPLHAPHFQPSALNPMLISLASFDQGRDVWPLLTKGDHPFNLLIHPSFLNLCSTTDLLSSPWFGRYMFYLRSNNSAPVIDSSNWPPFQAWSIKQPSEL